MSGVQISHAQLLKGLKGKGDNMATLKQALSEDEVKKLGVAQTRIEYNKIAKDYNRIINNEILLCPVCNTWQNAKEGFYIDKNNATGRFYECKRCLLKEVEQRKTDKDEPNETKESVQKVLMKMNRIYDDAFYEQCIKGTLDEVNEKQRHSAFSTYITSISSLPQWQNKTWTDSDFGNDNSSKSDEEIKIVQKIIKSAKKRFGIDYSNEDLMFLEQEYQDWVTRYECNTKAQESIFELLSLKKLERNKASKAGQSTKDIDKTYQELLNTANITPRQSITNSFNDSLTFGQMIEKWEQEKPIPEPDPEFKDVDNIGHYIRCWFSGWLGKILGIQNAWTQECDEEIAKYRVIMAEEQEDGGASDIYERMFGSGGE